MYEDLGKGLGGIKIGKRISGVYTDWERVLGDMQVGKGVGVYVGWGSGGVCRLGKEFWGCMKTGTLWGYKDWERNWGGMQVRRQTEARRGGGGGGMGRPLWTLQQNLVGCCLFLHLSPPGDRR